MKRLLFVIFILLMTVNVSLAVDSKVEPPADCKHCGMNRTKFAHSRMLITYKDGSSGTCSINCAAIDLKENAAREVKKVEVGDYGSRKLIDAKTAFWVIGGSVRGVMTSVAKWAFAEKNSAESFIKKNGGKLATFDEVLSASEVERLEKASGRGHGGHGM